MLSEIWRVEYGKKEPFENLKSLAAHFHTLRPSDLAKLSKRLAKLQEMFADKADQVGVLLRDVSTLLRSHEREINPFHEPLQIEVQRDAALAEMDAPMEGHILSIDEVSATASTPPRVEGR